MILGLGVDIVEVDRIRVALLKGASLMKRIFTQAEIAYCTNQRNQYQHLAGRFAAKEAGLKALGTGWGQGVRWKEVEVINEESGKPVIRFDGRALEILQEKTVSEILVTISHSEEYAVAVVVLEGSS
jgi:holo-[acyl-carrier protein] synthase